MRLTLRTLLAYLDQVLEPKDAEVLKGRIASSQLAATLVQRIRAGLKRRQLSAPPIIGRGLGGDPNTVAEYLDDTLATERVPEFEKVCMESDVQLTEVAACHQVLTVVLGQPAEIPIELRKRIIDLPNQPLPAFKKSKASSKPLASPNSANGQHRIDGAHVPIDGNVNPTVTAATKLREGQGIDLADHRIAEKVPEYLRGRASSTGRQILVAVGLVGLLIAVAWMSLGSLSNVLDMLGQKSPISRNNPDQNGSSTNPETHSANANASDVVSSQVEQGNADSSLGHEDSSEASNASDTDAAANPGHSADGKSLGIEPNSQVFPIGKWLPESREQAECVLLMGAESARWRRVASGESLVADKQLVIPPAYQTYVQFEPSLMWSFRAATSMRVSPPAASKGFVFDVAQTKAVIQSQKQEENRPISYWIKIDSSREIQVTMKDSVAVIALDIQPYWLIHNEWDSPRNLLKATKLVVLEGEVQCQMFKSNAALGTAATLIAGDGFGVVSEQDAIWFHLDQPPAWVVRTQEPLINKRAAEDLHRALIATTPDKMLEQLRLLTTDRRPEVAALATRTLCLLGDFESVFGDSGRLNSLALRSYWNSIVDDLRNSVAQSEERWKSLQASLNALQPDRSQQYLRLMVGYSQSQLEEGADQQLLEALQCDDLATRVLAANQLRRITGADQGYLADQPSPESLQHLRKLVTSGKMRYAILPVPFPEALTK